MPTKKLTSNQEATMDSDKPYLPKWENTTLNQQLFPAVEQTQEWLAGSLNKPFSTLPKILVTLFNKNQKQKVNGDSLWKT